MLITPHYLEQNKRLHETNAGYGASGHRHANQVKELAQMMGLKGEDILDYGCGKRTLEDAMDMKIRNYDPAIPGLEAIPEPAKLVVCTDMLEHVEPDCLVAVLDDLQRITKQILFATIATRKAKKFLPDGRNAHLIVEPLSYWLPRLWCRFTLMSMNNLGNQELMVIAGPLSMNVQMEQDLPD